MIRELIIRFLEYQVPYISPSGLISSHQEREGRGKKQGENLGISSSYKRLKGKKLL